MNNLTSIATFLKAILYIESPQSNVIHVQCVALQ
jgi:hypothetical protein